jgi:MFS family permease
MSCGFQGCFLLLFGRLADLYGRKKVFIMGSLFLTVFSLGLGFSNGITFAFVEYCHKKSNINLTDEVTIDILRGFQGIGTAATIPSAVRSFP